MTPLDFVRAKLTEHGDDVVYELDAYDELELKDRSVVAENRWSNRIQAVYLATVEGQADYVAVEYEDYVGDERPDRLGVETYVVLPNKVEVIEWIEQ